MKLSRSVSQWSEEAEDEGREEELTSAQFAAATEGLEKLLEQSDNIVGMTTGGQQ